MAIAKKDRLIETEWQNVPDDTSMYEGFVYLIINKTNNRKYIGRKYINSKRRTRPTKATKRRKLVISESDWKYYKSSSIELQGDIEKYGVENFSFVVLEWFENRLRTIYAEMEYQVKNDVLTRKLPSGDYEFYNTNILSKYFRAKNPSMRMVDGITRIIPPVV